MVKSYTADQLLAQVKSLNNYKEIPAGRWILGVRSNEDTPNKFDDKFYIFDNETFVMVLSGTTNPGTPTLTQFEKVNKAGAAVLKSDRWYYNVWQFGRHQGKVDALLQLGAKVDVYRDIDRDHKAEEQDALQSGYFGINFHPNTYKANGKGGELIGWWSAGCQVSNDERYWKLIAFFKANQKNVSYCLINEF